MQWSALRAEPGVVERSGTKETAADFSQALPGSLQSDSLLRWALQSAGSERVALQRLVFEPRAVAPGGLPQGDVVAGLRGVYPQVKAWVDGLRGRFPALALVKLEMRRVAALGSDGVVGQAGVPKAADVAAAVEIQADVRFRLYARPPREEAGLELARSVAPNAARDAAPEAARGVALDAARETTADAARRGGADTGVSSRP